MTTSRPRITFFVTLLTASFSMSISQSALSTAYPEFMQTFDLDAGTVSWLTTGFMLMMTLMIPISPWLLHRFSFKPLFQMIVFVFIIGTLLCMWAPNFTVLMGGRLAEAVAVGVLFPSFQTVMLAMTPEEARGQVMGMAGLVMGSALAVGPLISGIVLNWFSWRALFAVFLVVQVLVLCASIKTIYAVLPHEEIPLDWSSVILSTGFPLLLFVATAIAKNGAKWSLVLLGGLSFVLAVAFSLRQWHLARPMINLKVFRVPIFTRSVFLTSFAYIGLIVTTILMPLYFQQVLHETPFHSGFALVPGAVVLSLLNPIAGRWLDRVGPRPVVTFGMGAIMLGFLGLGLGASHLNLWSAIFFSLIVEAGNAFAMMPSVTAGVTGLADEAVSDGTAVITTVRQIMGAAGVAVATLCLDQFHRITGHLIVGFGLTFLLFACIAFLGMLLAAHLPRKLRSGHA